MPIYIGDKEITDLFIGDKRVKEVYLGTTKVWPTTTDQPG